ncbi:putative xanthine dehydrogenase subunit E [Cohnella xylanilytica]|uniref:(2Fe-2S)-binding protein n=1 Tax=Cohnella xylanilytica TaxID=557555 RepID=A0A841TVY5_9BACL|nr:(2Fe-2S)-binding protein [Cohnella xylanilytica]MBB6690343.1 (2Fe-2S)-binding protein [Cohnella xylanilytica]GIO10821.1 putative xanthine dehydrogenase subunit E [Cohnella xylanilytica]
MIDKTLAQRSAGAVLECEVNGRKIAIETPPARRLLSILRDDLGLTGTKRSCEIGRCGACMVLIDGKPRNSCLTMAYQCSGRSITTIEGLADEERLHPVQECFLEEGGYQCGYCTPGMIVSVKALLDDTPDPTMEQIEEALTGNLCRCTGYGGILRSVARAIERGGEAT